MNRLDQESLLGKAESVLKRLTNLENQEFDKELDPWKGFASRDFGIETWDWPQGVGLYGMEKLQAYYGDSRYDDFFAEWVANNQKEGLPSANINTTAPYNMLIALAQRTGRKEYEEMCRERAEWLMNGLPRTKEGGFQHVTTDLYDKNGTILNEEQLWVDTLFMAVLFLARAGVEYDRKEWREEAVCQILIHIKYLYDKQTGLFHHGWSFERCDNFGGVFWGRGNSWFTYGILALLDILGEHVERPLRDHILNCFKAQVAALSKLQAESGLWHTILTDAESYEEVSGSAAFAAGIFRGIRMGILDESYLECAEKALAAVVRNIDEDGSVQNVSGGTAIGLNADHYKNIIIASMPYGQSMAMLALVEALEYYA